MWTEIRFNSGWGVAKRKTTSGDNLMEEITCHLGRVRMTMGTAAGVSVEVGQKRTWDGQKARGIWFVII